MNHGDPADVELPTAADAPAPAIPSSRRDWTALMARLGIRPNKGLGQNFLFERGIVQRMVRSARIGADDTVVEVGPGLGILTDELLLRCGRVIAIELDRTLAAHLTSQFGDNPKFSLHSGDALRVDLDHVLAGVAAYKLAANLPYGVAAAVIRRFLEADKAPTQLTVMLQLEVAERLVATPPNMTILSVATQFYSVPRIAFHVHPTVFIPPPNVESAVAILDVRPEPPLLGTDRDLFFKIVNAGFRQKRKQVANSMAAELDLPKAQVLAWLADAGIDSMRRAQTLTVDEWIGVTLAAPAELQTAA
jgi:16S rRNA (adenine1518-N6/adenine1519-N6)-dimethyltransferase